MLQLLISIILYYNALPNTIICFISNAFKKCYQLKDKNKTTSNI